MKNLFLVFILFISVPAALFPKEPVEVTVIREWYQKVRQMIDAKTGILVSEWNVNQKGVEFPIIGRMIGKAVFYWKAEGTNNQIISKLLKITVEKSMGEYFAYQEFLYDLDGKLIFLLDRWKNGGGDVMEYRVYFKKDKPFYVSQTIEKTGKVFEFFSIPEVYAPEFSGTLGSANELVKFFELRPF